MTDFNRFIRKIHDLFGRSRFSALLCELQSIARLLIFATVGLFVCPDISSFLDNSHSVYAFPGITGSLPIEFSN